MASGGLSVRRGGIQRGDLCSRALRGISTSDVDSWRDEVCNKRRATLAVRARGAGAAGQDQVVDELALSNLIYGRSINQDFFAAAPRGRCRLFLLPLQFMFDGAGGAGDDGHCDKEARGRHLAVRCSLRLHGTRTSSRGKVLSRYSARAAWPECGGHAIRPARPSRGRLRSRVARLALQILQLAQSFQVSAA